VYIYIYIIFDGVCTPRDIVPIKVCEYSIAVVCNPHESYKATHFLQKQPKLGIKFIFLQFKKIFP